MKKYFEIIYFIILTLFSFVFSTKTNTVFKNMDNLMVKIKEESYTHKKDYVDAKIDDDIIMPGISGKEVDIEASYDNMKKVGTYNENMLVYKKIKPEISIDNIYNKYIVKGNGNKVSLIFKVDTNDDIDSILNILDKYDIKANFFATETFDKKILNLTKLGHVVGSVTNDTWVNTLVTKVANQKNSYCYLEEKNDEVLNICRMNKQHAILPNIKAFKTPTLIIKKNISDGAIISMDVNKTIIK